LCRVYVYESEDDVATELAASMIALKHSYDNWHNERPFPKWGAFQGAGIAARAQYEGGQYDVRVFIRTVDGVCLEIWEMCAVGDLKQVHPGFQQIESTFRFKLEAEP
jgi:hypothetical protein